MKNESIKFLKIGKLKVCKRNGPGNLVSSCYNVIIRVKTVSCCLLEKINIVGNDWFLCNLLQWSHTSEKYIQLSKLDFSASGVYSCEVSMETPIYTKDSNRHELTVIRKYRHTSFLYNNDVLKTFSIRLSIKNQTIFYIVSKYLHCQWRFVILYVSNIII